MSLFCPECHTRYEDASKGVCPKDGVRLYKVDDDDPLIGGVIDGRFRVDYTLGIGGMGTVYGGVQLSVNRDVAIKVLRTELSTREVALERFFREAKTISKLSHPNIVKLIDFGQDRDRGLLYLVMELVRGQNLADLLSKGRLRTPLALEVIYQVCGALTEPHAESVIHRDLKPDNLLLVPVSDGTVQAKVLDFGIARFMESNTQLTGTGMICGTPAYMAPEQAQNETLDPRTDLYALGVILYEMLSGWPPFSGTSSLQVMLKHIQENPPPLRELLPPATLPNEIEDLVYSLISKERALRPASAREVRDTIDAIRARFGLENVRFDAATSPDVEQRFSKFLLPKLPRPHGEKSGPTQVLRRETGLNVSPLSEEADVPTNVFRSDTEADEGLGVTGPLTPDQRLDVAGDAHRIKLQTRDGGQQAWTPGDQAAIRSIKDTKDVDAMGATVDAPSMERKPPRKTMVEADDSTPVIDVRPSTGDAIKPASTEEVAAAKVKPDVTQETRERKSGNLPLLSIALFCGVAVLAAAGFVVKKIDDVVSQKPPTPAVVEPAAAVAAPAKPAPDAEALSARIAAHVSAQNHVHFGVELGARETQRPPQKTKTPDKPKEQVKQEPKAPPRKEAPREAPPKAAPKVDKVDIDQKIKNILGDE